MTTFPAHLVKTCAFTAGAYSMIFRESTHSYTGWVVEARFQKATAARGFARVSAQCIGIAVACRRNGRGWAVSVPCSIV